MKASPSLLVALLLIGYALPWVTTPTIAGVTNNAYDLAEWVSITPVVRAEALLLTPLLLRLPLVCIAVFVAISDVRRPALGLRLFGLLLLAIALLPPLEFFTSASDDANYQQSFLLAVTALLLGGIGAFMLRRLHVRVIALIRIGTLVAAVVAGGVGLARALPILRAFGIDAQIGIGAPTFASVCLGGIVWALSRRAQSATGNETG